jgi:uncharacterized membrane protein YdjX (TVP38/TMEM64 family)
MAALRDGLRSLGPYGAPAFIALEAAWTMSTLPSAPLMTLGGLLYGFWLSGACILVSNLLGSGACFWLGRTLLGRRVSTWTQRHERLRQALQLIESKPIASVVVARFTSVFPLSLMGYAIGTTRVLLLRYAGAVLLGVLPGAVLYSGIGTGLWRGFGP